MGITNYENKVMIRDLTVGAAMTAGTPVYVDGSSVIQKAQANAVATLAIGYVSRDVTADDIAAGGDRAKACVLASCLQGGYTGLTPGAKQYLSGAAAGAEVAAPPKYPLLLGYAISATQVAKFRPVYWLAPVDTTAIPELVVYEGNTGLTAINNGTEIVPGRAGRQFTALYVRAVARGGAGAAATDVRFFFSTTTTSVILAVPIALVLENIWVGEQSFSADHSTSVPTSSYLAIAGPAGEGVKIGKSGSSLTTLTSMDWIIIGYWS